MLSLIELQRKKVEAKRKKYDKDEMDSYLELVYENYKELIEENKKLEAEKNELNQKNKKLSDGVQYYHSIETTLQKALILAEKTSKETKDAAILKAEAIEKEANTKADEIIRTAEGEYNKIKGKCLQLVQQFNEYKLQLIEAASTQLQLVEGDEFDISNPDEFEKTLDIPVVKETKKTVSQKAAAKQAARPAQQEQQTPPVQPVAAAEPVNAAASKNSTPVVKEANTAATREDILNADTIDLRVTLDAVRTEAEQASGSVEPQKQPDVQNAEVPKAEAPKRPVAEKLEPQKTVTEKLEPQKIETEVLEPQEMKLEPIDTLEVSTEPDTEDSKLDVAKVADVKSATIVEPIQAKTVAPMDIVFEDEIAANEETEKEAAQSSAAEKAAEAVPTLDSLLQDLNINNKSNQKSDDPFEFLGSVDDF